MKQKKSTPKTSAHRVKYVICGYYDFNKSDQTLNATLKSNNYLIGNKIKPLPVALTTVSPGDILLLRYERKIVAYGEATSTLTLLSQKNSNKPFYNYEIKVERWVRFDKNNPQAGIRADNVMKNCAPPLPKIRDIAKVVRKRFAQSFIDKIAARQP